jgi:hypothetical protein
MVRWYLPLLVVAAGCRFDASGLANAPDLDLAVADMVADVVSVDQPPRDVAVRPDRRLDQRRPDQKIVPCNPSTCPGCCAGTMCWTPSAAVCGLGGAKCVACASGESCTAAGICTCSKSADCDGFQVCRKKVCATLDGQWDVEVVSAEVTMIDPATGKQWDADSPPDPYVLLKVGAVSDQTPKAENTTTPAWQDQVFGVTITQADTLEIQVYDCDTGSCNSPTGDDKIGELTYDSSKPPPFSLMAVLKAGKIEYKATDPKAGLQKLLIKLTPFN